MSLLYVSDKIKNQFIFNQRNSITELDRELFEIFIQKLEECKINDICGFYMGKSQYFHSDFDPAPHIFHPEYILIANKQPNILTSNTVELDNIALEENPPKRPKRGGRKKNKNKDKKNRSKRIKQKKKRTYKKFI